MIHGLHGKYEIPAPIPMGGEAFDSREEERLFGRYSHRFDLLKGEANPALRAQGLLHLAESLDSDGKTEGAVALYSILAGEEKDLSAAGIPTSIHHRAQKRLAVLLGQSNSWGDHFENFSRQLLKDLSDPSVVLPMVLSLVFFRVARNAALACFLPFANGMPLGAMSMQAVYAAANVVGFLSETAAITSITQGITAIAQKKPPTFAQWSHQYYDTFLLLAPGKLPVFLGQPFKKAAAVMASRGLAGVALRQGTLLAGIAAGHGLQQFAGTQPKQSAKQFALSALMSFGSMNASMAFTEHFLGARLARWEAALDQQAARIIQEGPRGIVRNPIFQPALAVMVGGLGDAPKGFPIDPLIGTTIGGKYKVEKQLGRGGMGVVYKARHERIGRDVAIKMLLPELAGTPSIVERFLREGQAPSKISSDYVVSVTDADTTNDGIPYIVMEYLNGKPLFDSLFIGSRQIHVPVPRLLQIGIEIARGLKDAHEAGFIHRDLKPENIFIEIKKGKEIVKILDFGLAGLLAQKGHETQIGFAQFGQPAGRSKLTQLGPKNIMGTPEYMSPEQTRGEEADHRSDIYSFGVVLYEMASGRLPFNHNSEDRQSVAEHIMNLHRSTPPTSLLELSSKSQEIPTELNDLILKCMRKRPEDRYQSMRDIVAELERIQQAISPAPLPSPIPSPQPIRSGRTSDAVTLIAQKPASQKPILYGALGLGILGLGVFAIKNTLEDPDEDSEAEILQPTARNSTFPIITPSTATPIASAVSSSKEISFSVEPKEAHVWMGGEDQGPAGSFRLQVDPGIKFEIEIRNPGYESQKISIADDSDAKQIIALKPLKPIKPVIKPTSTTTSSKPIIKKPTVPPASTIIRPN